MKKSWNLLSGLTWNGASCLERVGYTGRLWRGGGGHLRGKLEGNLQVVGVLKDGKRKAFSTARQPNIFHGRYSAGRKRRAFPCTTPPPPPLRFTAPWDGEDFQYSRFNLRANITNNEMRQVRGKVGPIIRFSDWENEKPFPPTRKPQRDPEKRRDGGKRGGNGWMSLEWYLIISLERAEEF